jgi:hypothetical protein
MSSGSYSLQSSRGKRHDWRRDPEKFADPKNIKYELNGSHTFDSGFILGGLSQYNDRALSERASQNFEGTIGYRAPLSCAFTLIGSAGVGERS